MLFGGKNINDYLDELKDVEGALLMDVREADEYAAGHIPGSVNVPLSAISQYSGNKNARIYVYCLRGARSRKAVKILQEIGCKNAISIGGINKYKGPVESGDSHIRN